MQIVKVVISNYRNLDGVEITFEPKINFLVGENECGKSNLLDLFEILFNHRQFSDDDYFEINKPIRIEFALRLTDVEIGTFGDYFDPDDNKVINVHATQEYSDLDEDIVFFWLEDENHEPIEIPNALFRNVNYIIYDSLILPREELTFYRGRGSGRFLRHLINELVDPDLQVNVDDILAPIINEIQLVFDRLKPLKRQGLGLFTDKENSPDFASRALKLTGVDGFDIQKSGCGIQFSTLLLLTILERLVFLKQNKRFRPFEERREFFTEEEYEVFREMHFSIPIVQPILEAHTNNLDGKFHINIDELSDEDKDKLGDSIINHINIRKHISIILGLDEPEIHLHPYMQRSLIKYICELLENQDRDFLFLLKKYFDIDALDGQVLIASHSPTIFLDRYEHIVRFCKEDNKVVVVSGSDLALDHNIEKHLLLNFPYVTEAFFSKCVIVVEGETEVGAIPLWGNKIIGDLDEYGITVIGVGGIKSVPPITTLLDHFRIPYVSIIDKDENNHTNPDFTSIDGLRTTNRRDFEEELFDSVCSEDAKVTVLFEFLEYYGDKGLERYAYIDRLTNIASKYGITQTWDTAKHSYTFEEIKESDDTNLLKAMFLSWMTGDKTGKNITLGRALGHFIEKEFIPLVFHQLFEDARSKVVPQ